MEPRSRSVSRQPARAWSLSVAVLTVAVLGALGSGEPGRSASTPPGLQYRVVKTWGGPGTTPGTFGTVVGGLATDTAGRLFVADTNNARIQVFSARGRYLRQYTVDPHLTDVAIGPDGDVWATVGSESQVRRYPKAGGTTSQGVPVFRSADGLAVDADGNLIVADNGDATHAVIRYDKAASYAETARWTGMRLPGDVEVAPDGTVYVADRVGSPPNVRRHSGAGTLLGRIPLDMPATSQTGVTLGVGVDPDCNVWTTNTPKRQIALYSPGGKLLATAAANDLIASDVAVSPKGDVYVWDSGTQRVIRFAEVRTTPQPATLVGRPNVTLSEEAAGWALEVTFVASGIACPEEIDAVASLTGVLRGSTQVEVAAGKPTVIDIPLPGATVLRNAGKDLTGTVKIVLETNGRPTTRTASVRFHVPEDAS